MLTIQKEKKLVRSTQQHAWGCSQLYACDCHACIMLLMAAVVSCVTIALLLAFPSIVAGLIDACLHVYVQFIVFWTLRNALSVNPNQLPFLSLGLIWRVNRH